MTTRLLTIVLVFAGVTAGVAQEQARPVRRVDSAVLYLKHCASCHGQKGEGMPGVRPLDGELAHGSEVEDIAKVIRDGIADTPMTPFKDKLNAQQIKLLAEYVRDMSKR